jgi:hypothetical protein
MQRSATSAAAVCLGLAVCACRGTGVPGGQTSPRLEVRHVTDGAFDEWSTTPPLLQDPPDAPPPAAIDIRNVSVADDGRAVYLAIDLGRVVNAQSMRGTLRLVLNADGDQSTGATVGATRGVDLIVELSRRDRPRSAGYGAGNGIRFVSADGPGNLRSGYEVGLLVAPTTSASRLEVRMDRGAMTPDGRSLFTGPALDLSLDFVDAGGVRDETTSATHRFEALFEPDAPPGEPRAAIARTPGNFRTLQWNVAGTRLRDRSDAFARVLTALAPDVLLLDEVYETVTSDDLRKLFAAVGPAGAAWRFVIGRGGGRQKGVIASRRPMREEPRLRQVPYPAGSLASLEASIDDPAFEDLLAVERRIGLATAGAWVTLGDREGLFVPVDLQSGGYDGSAEDRLRELQAITLRDVVAQVAGRAPLVIAGDLNLVGSSRPLERLGAGLDAGRDLDIAPAYRLGDRSFVTWRDVDHGPFTPGRLDYTLFTASTLELVGSFSFDASALSPAALAAAGLRGDESTATSGHLPVVCDFRWR